MTAAPHFVRAFLDTEFTDFVDIGLISIALVTTQGDEFYAEVDDVQVERCNVFVRQNVLPLLGKVPGAQMSRIELRSRLLAWLAEIRRGDQLVVISYDFFGDWSLFAEAVGDIPGWVRPDNVRDRIDEAHRESFFGIAVEWRHHAAFDARALRASYFSDQDE